MYGLIALNFIIPFVMVFVGYILKKHPVKDMTSCNGYNTPCLLYTSFPVPGKVPGQAPPPSALTYHDRSG